MSNPEPEKKDCQNCSEKKDHNSGCLGLVCGILLLGYAIPADDLLAVVLGFFLILSCL